VAWFLNLQGLSYISSCKLPRFVGLRPATEFASWSIQDNIHRRFAVLDGPLGRQIGTALALMSLQTDSRCLTCHSTYLPREQQGENFNVKEGVGAAPAMARRSIG